jgi:hypothetical protein
MLRNIGNTQKKGVYLPKNIGATRAEIIFPLGTIGETRAEVAPFREIILSTQIPNPIQRASAAD